MLEIHDWRISDFSSSSLDLADAQGGVTTFRPIFQQKQDIDFTGIVELNETNFREVAHDKSVHTFVLFTSFKWYCVECHRANYFWPLLADKYKDDATLKFAFWDLDHHDPKPLNIKVKVAWFATKKVPQHLRFYLGTGLAIHVLFQNGQ